MSIEITKEQAQAIVYFIRSNLERSWDRYTDKFIVDDGETDEQGMRRMDPGAYDLADVLEQKLLEL